MKNIPGFLDSGKIVSAIVFLLLGVESARADWRFDAETGAFYDSNLSRSDRSADEKDDWAWRSEVRIGYGVQLNRELRLNLTADLRDSLWARFDAFNNLAGGGSAALRYRFGLGPQAPWILVEDRIAYAFFNEDDRSGLDNKLRLRGGVAITERVSVEAAYTFDHFEAEDRFFTLTGHSGALRLTIDVTSSLQIGFGYAFRNGDVISYAVPPRPDLVLLAPNRRPVNTFGSPPYTAYPLEVATHTLSASVGYVLTKNISVQASYEYAHSLHDPLEYVNHMVEAKFVIAY